MIAQRPNEPVIARTSIRRRPEHNGKDSRAQLSPRRVVGAEANPDCDFTVLIGSRARRTEDAFSDVDIVRVGHTRPVRRIGTSRVKPTYVDYDQRLFSALYDRGDLFLYHVLKEGRLLEGNKDAWALLKENFRVASHFGEQISRHRNFLRWLQRGSKHDGATVPYLAHLCRGLKNLAIFSLAEKRDYIFDKRQALRRAFPALSENSISLLVTANNTFERQPSGRPYPVISSANIKRLNKEVAAAANLPGPNVDR